MSTRGERRMRSEIAADARVLALVEVREELKAEYRKVYGYTRIPGILRRGILSGLSTALNIIERRIEGRPDDSKSVREGADRPDAGESC